MHDFEQLTIIQGFTTLLTIWMCMEEFLAHSRQLAGIARKEKE
jgi:hypothetical protein